jgi:hypothetical protein
METSSTPMRFVVFTVLSLMFAIGAAVARIGDNDKQIEAIYGEPGKILGEHGNYRQVGYAFGGFMILVDFVDGISQREGFANPDQSKLSDSDIQMILAISAGSGADWQELASGVGDRSWQRSDGKAVAVLPPQGKALYVQDIHFVQPKQ